MFIVQNMLTNKAIFQIHLEPVSLFIFLLSKIPLNLLTQRTYLIHILVIISFSLITHMNKLVLFLVAVLLATSQSLQVAHQAVTINCFPKPMTDLTELRNAELQRHNELRAKHGSPALILDDALNAQAQAYAETLMQQGALQHSSAARNGKVGQNLKYAGGPLYTEIKPFLNLYGSSYNFVKLPLYTSSDSWYSQNANYNYLTASSKNGKATGHFTAMIWKSVSKVGFGYAWKKSGPNSYEFWAVANYLPIPNVYLSSKNRIQYFVGNVTQPK